MPVMLIFTCSILSINASSGRRDVFGFSFLSKSLAVLYMWYFVRPAGAGVEREEYLYIISVFNVSTDSFFIQMLSSAVPLEEYWQMGDGLCCCYLGFWKSAHVAG